MVSNNRLITLRRVQASWQLISISNLLKVNEYIKYCLLTGSLLVLLDMKGKTETEVEEVMNLFIKLFTYLYSRDAFLKIYAK